MSESKQNIFEHIFYEFDMYEATYLVLAHIDEVLAHISADNKEYGWVLEKQFFLNTLLESHGTHLRILIRFFSKVDSVNCATVFIKDPMFEVENWKDKSNKISQALSHITKERHETQNLSGEFINIVNNEYQNIHENIEKFKALLLDEKNIKDEYRKDLYSYCSDRKGYLIG